MCVSIYVYIYIFQKVAIYSLWTVCPCFPQIASKALCFDGLSLSGSSNKKREISNKLNF